MAEPRVLVLDEATSNLDLKSETMVEAALDVLLEGRRRPDRPPAVHGNAGRPHCGRRRRPPARGGLTRRLVAPGGHYAEMYETWISQSHQA